MTKEQIEEIKKWDGFEDFQDSDVNFIHEYENFISEKKCTTSVLMEAVKRGHFDIVSNLIKKGSNVNYVSKTTNQTPLLSLEDDTTNKVEISKELIENGADVNFISEYDKDLLKEFDGLLGVEAFETALSKACGFGNFELIKLLIENGANVNDKSNPISCLNPELPNVDKIADYLITNGADINSSGGEFLKTALLESRTDLIDKLTSFGAKTDISKKSSLGGRTSLMLLLDNEALNLDEEEEEVVFYKLWKNLENINIQDNEGKSLLFYALDNYLGEDDFSLKIFDLIITHPNLDINLTDVNGNTALNYLLKKINEELEDNLYDIDEEDLYKIKMLVIGKTKIDLSNKLGQSPRSFFTNMLNEQITDFLKAPARLINEENELGYTLLLNSVINDDIQKTNWLLNNGAIVDLKCKANGQYNNWFSDDRLVSSLDNIRYTDEKGITALMLANSMRMIELLVKKGAYIDSQDYQNNSVLMYYSSRQWFEGVKTLLDFGANPNIKNKDYDTALSLAKRAGRSSKSNRQIELLNLLKRVTEEKLIDKLLLSANRIKKMI